MRGRCYIIASLKTMEALYDSDKGKTASRSQAVAPTRRSHLLCVRVQHVGSLCPSALLTDIAASFSLTEAQAGIIMISVYAWGRHAAVVATHGVRFALRVQADAAGRACRVLARPVPVRRGAHLSHFGFARLVVACAHAVFWSVASIMASRWLHAPRGARHPA